MALGLSTFRREAGTCFKCFPTRVTPHPRLSTNSRSSRSTTRRLCLPISANRAAPPTRAYSDEAVRHPRGTPTQTAVYTTSVPPVSSHMKHAPARCAAKWRQRNRQAREVLLQPRDPSQRSRKFVGDIRCPFRSFLSVRSTPSELTAACAALALWAASHLRARGSSRVVTSDRVTAHVLLVAADGVSVQSTVSQLFAAVAALALWATPHLRARRSSRVVTSDRVTAHFLLVAAEIVPVQSTFTKPHLFVLLPCGSPLHPATL